MNIKTILLATAVFSTATGSSVLMADTTKNAAFSDVQKKEVQTIIHDYLLNNPEILIEASQVLQQKQQQVMQQQALGAIKENASQLFNDKFTVLGNPKGDVTVVEFFDYQCVHCKKMAPVMNDLIKKNPNLRVIYKEFPIFGKSSDTAAKAALGAATLNHYSAAHDALLNQEQRLTDQLIMDTVARAGINAADLKKAMDSKAVSDALEANRQLAEKMHLMGTPAFIVAATPNGQFKADSTPAFVPGAATEEALQDLIKKAASH